MSQQTENLFIDRYNFSRRVVDHRVPFDLNYSINQPKGSQLWWKAYKQKQIGNFLNLTGLVYATYGVGIGLLLLGIDAWVRSKVYGDSHKSRLDVSRQPYGHVFYENYRNQGTKLGRWNHNFFCFEKQPGCGQDFE
ncbi:hypothetical protein IMG5_091050 [Ichthyophthirius multifiliis]|uniref:Uncharacterized protein n=1 Tax=Ichthyophthirius multifiliis TaxID=5932 RepID=G0QRA4_ICHMU|nr:hypothetical protein IMG5_091050 [Ichthyophthirius multifiliis]EGR32256.1 hypothetical protein IMG5_091050 [Ichthyophthirius multifiliis]|eukprot:XP_004035742.1 hypothetical protein IMG5_091050 [Ichthyophthirius multifiliis]